jgi:hypothetical protein
VFVDYHSILNIWKNYLCRLLNVHGDDDVCQTEADTAEILAHDPSSFLTGIAIKKLERYKITR